MRTGLGETAFGWKTSRKRILVDLSELALVGDGHQLVGEVHHDAVVAGTVLGEGGLELGGHQRRVAGGLEQVVEARAQRVALGVVEMEAATDSAAEREQVGVTEALG